MAGVMQSPSDSSLNPELRACVAPAPCLPSASSTSSHSQPPFSLCSFPLSSLHKRQASKEKPANEWSPTAVRATFPLRPPGRPYPGGQLVGAVQGAGAGVQHVVLDQHRDGPQDEGEEQVEVDVVPGAVQPPVGRREILTHGFCEFSGMLEPLREHSKVAEQD